MSRPLELDPRRLWAALMVALNIDVCASILAGRPVRAGQLDRVVLRRALRGERLPDPESFIRIRTGHLDAIAEAGPLPAKGSR